MAEKEEKKTTPPTDEELQHLEQMAALQQVVSKAVSEIEGRLADKLQEIAVKVDANIKQVAAEVKGLQERQEKQGAELTETLMAAPQLIQGLIEEQIKANYAGIMEQYKQQIDGKVAAANNSGKEGEVAAPAVLGGFDIGSLLKHSDEVIKLVNAFRPPANVENEMMSQMNFVMKWHNILSKFEKGGGASEDITKAISEATKS